MCDVICNCLIFSAAPPRPTHVLLVYYLSLFPVPLPDGWKIQRLPCACASRLDLPLRFLGKQGSLASVCFAQFVELEFIFCLALFLFFRIALNLSSNIRFCWVKDTYCCSAPAACTTSVCFVGTRVPILFLKTRALPSGAA